MPSREVFYLHLSGEQRGPYTVPQIDHLLHSGLIGEETLYWREGLEQWTPVTELVTLRKRPKPWRRLIVPAVMMVPLLLLLALFGPPLVDAWREATAQSFTVEDAYWHARDTVRHGAATDGSVVTFEHFKTAGVELLQGHIARVVLRGQIAPSDGPPRNVTWRVQLPYDVEKGEWLPGTVKAEGATP